MSAYIKPIPKHQCQVCRWKKATVELFNSLNASLGYFCGVCGKRRLAELNKNRKEVAA